MLALAILGTEPTDDVSPSTPVAEAPTHDALSSPLSLHKGQVAAFVAVVGRPSPVDLLSPDGATAVNSAYLDMGFALSDTVVVRVLFGGTLLASQSMALWGFNVGVGGDFYFRQPTDRVRPLVGALVRAEKYASAEAQDFALNVGGRVGAAVFPWSFLAVRVTGGIDVPMQLRHGVFGLQVVPFELGIGVFF